MIACGPFSHQPCQVGQDGSMEGTTIDAGIPSWLCFPPPGAHEGQTIGDGVCHGWANTAECGYDGGDCEEDFPNCNPPTWILIDWIGDGVCDTELNNPDCENDGGDCDDMVTPATIQPITTMQPDNCSPSHWIGKFCKKFF